MSGIVTNTTQIDDKRHKVSGVSEKGDGRDHLRLASSRPFSVIDGPRHRDPYDEPLAEGTPRPALTSIALRVDGDRLEATSTLALHGRVLNGHCFGKKVDRTAIVASATLGALGSLLECEATVESALVLEVGGVEVSLTVITLGGETEPETLVGSAIIRGDLEDATARSVLSALNRRLTR